MCQFPYKLRGRVMWDCVDAKDSRGSQRKACNVKESSKIQSFQDISTFHACGECEESTVLEDGNNYGGFGLTNNNDHNYYGDIHTKEECQILCDITPGCNFFNYNGPQLACYLKYGIGESKSQIDVKFGFKGCKGVKLRLRYVMDGGAFNNDIFKKTLSGFSDYM